MTSEVKENNTFYANFVHRNINYPHGIDVAKKSDFLARLVCMVWYIKILF